MVSRTGFAVLFLAALAGCGGSTSVSINDGPVAPLPTFILWSGSSGGERVVDASNDAYAFYTDSGCLYNFRTGRENPNFCLTSEQNTVRYGALFMRVVNVLSTAGTCIAGLVEESTAYFIDIELDAFGREVAIVTALRPTPCY